tara:strand:+ start:176 stop:709 length:534 start_codon:yes stop_codon:yes gene_type:complete
MRHTLASLLKAKAMELKTLTLEKVNSHNKSSFLVKMCIDPLQLEGIIFVGKQSSSFLLNFTLLVKLPHEQLKDEAFKIKLKRKLGKNVKTGYFNNPTIGIVYCAGPLTQLFLEEINGSVLGAMQTGVEGILRGLDVDKECATVSTEKLAKGHYMLIVSGDPNDISKLKLQLGNNCQD